jgi:hypothetical protein
VVFEVLMRIEKNDRIEVSKEYGFVSDSPDHKIESTSVESNCVEGVGMMARFLERHK